MQGCLSCMQKVNPIPHEMQACLTCRKSILSHMRCKAALYAESRSYSTWDAGLPNLQKVNLNPTWDTSLINVQSSVVSAFKSHVHMGESMSKLDTFSRCNQSESMPPLCKQLIKYCHPISQAQTIPNMIRHVHYIVSSNLASCLSFDFISMADNWDGK